MTLPPGVLEMPAARGARLLALDRLSAAAEARSHLGDDDPDGGGNALHDFRVALRRLLAALADYRKILRGSVRRRDRKRAAALLSATGTARDAEVHARWIDGQAESLSADERKGGDWMLRRIRRDTRKADGGADLGGDFDRIDRRLRKRLSTYRMAVDGDDADGRPLLATVLGEAIQSSADRLRARLGRLTDEVDPVTVHRARLAVKRLRYLLEPFADALPGGVALFADLRAMQETLGAQHDAWLLAQRVADALLRAQEDGGRADVLPGLRALAERLAEAQRQRGDAVGEACTPERVGALCGRAESVAAAAAERGRGNLEVERKYLLRRLPRLPAEALPVEIWQGWIAGERLNERIRRTLAPDGRERWHRTVKLGTGVSRVEVEEETPVALARRLWPLTAGRRVRKRRWKVPDGALTWEIDRFAGGKLVLAEVELPSPDHPVTLPEWLRPCLVREVTGDPRYVNLNLAR
ncbi:MAG: domain containing protein [Gemmatimonadetes bacterium]|nr:domain containing protein [Gemmatimonadota bacterium]